MKKLWNKFTDFLYSKIECKFIDSLYEKEEWTKEDEEYFRRKLYKAVKYDPFAIDYGEGCWIPIRTKKEKDNV